MVTCRLFAISRFNVMEPPVEQLKHLTAYKKCYVYEWVARLIIVFPLFIFSIMLALYFMGPDTSLAIFFIILGALAGIICGWFGWKKHRTTMQEIEHHLAELHDIEPPSEAKDIDNP